MHRIPRPTPALALSLVALFFALGGTAFAVGSKELAGQPRCATGAVRGIAVVTGEKVGLDTLTSAYTSNPGLFRFHWSCAGGKVLVRKANGPTAVDIKFVGNPSTIAIVSSAADGTPNGGSVARQPDGSFRVTMGGSNTGVPGPWEAQWNIPFVIVLL
jgi:hypothetical protein